LIGTSHGVTLKGYIIILIVILLIGTSQAMFARQVTVTLGTRASQGGAYGERFLGWEDGYRAILEEFNQTHPDIKVEFQPITGDLVDQLTVQMIAGEGPDVFEAWGDFATNFAQSGMLVDLNPFIERDMTDEEIKDFIPSQWEANRIKDSSGRIITYGVPRYLNNGILYFNATMFNEAGLISPIELVEDGQWTWNNVLELAKKLVRYEGDRITRYGYKFVDPWNHVFSNGGRVFNYPENPTQFVMDQPRALEALEYISDLIWKYQVAPSDRWGVWLHNSNTAMDEVWGTCWIADMTNAVGGKFDWDIVDLAVSPNGMQIPWAALDIWAMNGNTKHPEEAWELLRFLTSREGMELQARYMGLQPSRISVMSTYMEVFPGKNIQAIARMAVKSRPQPGAGFNSKEAVALVQQILDMSLWSNEKSVKQAVEEIAPTIRSRLAESRSK